jgi:hypothetical protein
MGELGSVEPKTTEPPSGVFARIWALYEEGGILVACAWCGRIRLDEHWLRPPRSVVAAVDAPNMFSHSICEDCTTQAANAAAARF